MENNDNLKNYHVESGSADSDYQSINKKNNKKIVTIILIALFVFVVLMLIVFNRDKIFTKKQSAPVVTEENEKQEKQEVFAPELNDEEFNKYYKIPDEYANDKDRDGLSSEEEEKLGTSDLKYDTDGDGISDKIEVEELGTDPTNKDTDGDGFSDAFEISKGYNPKGEGKLQR